MFHIYSRAARLFVTALTGQPLVNPVGDATPHGDHPATGGGKDAGAYFGAEPTRADDRDGRADWHGMQSTQQ